MACKKHKLKFVHVGGAPGRIDTHIGSAYLTISTWDFRCVWCPFTKRVDREAMRNRLVGRRGVPEWIL